MSLFHRAVLYVTRKKSKSLLLLLLLLVIATLTLSGAAIQGATNTAMLNVRQALGGVFTLEQNTSDPSKWVSTQVGSYGTTSYYDGAPLTAELADYIETNVSGISGSNASYLNYVVPYDKDGSMLELLESDSADSGLSAMMASMGDMGSTVSAYASTNTAYDSYFSGGYIALTDGRHFTDADGNVAIISRALAEKNGLQLGDKLTLRMSQFKAEMMGYGDANPGIGVEIIGFFDATVKSTTSFSNWSMDNSIYTTMEVVRTVRPDMGDECFEKIQFYVNDPGELESIVKQVKALPELDASDFIVSADTSNADAVTGPLQNMNKLVTVLVLLIAAVGAVILYLVLASRIKERVHECGVLLSIGLSKRNIAAQFLAEILLLAVIAFPFSIVTSNAVAQTVGDQLLRYAVSESTTNDEATSAPQSRDGIAVADSSTYAPDFGGKSSMTEIEVSVSPPAILMVFCVSFAIIVGSVMIAALPVLKMKPREILSKMS